MPSLLAAGPVPEDTQDDYILAQMLQLEYDREHDHQLLAEEKHFNKHSTGMRSRLVLLKGQAMYWLQWTQ